MVSSLSTNGYYDSEGGATSRHVMQDDVFVSPLALSYTRIVAFERGLDPSSE